MKPNRQLWLLAGGNGAGKSTFYRLYLQPKKLLFLNADLIAKQIDKENPEKVSYEAAAAAGKLRSSLLQQNISFCFETVFSHPSKIDFVAEAKAFGYETILIYIHLSHSELNQARVAQRVSEGGHSVPADKIIARIPRTLAHIRTALPLFDTAQFYDNSSREIPFRHIARINHAGLVDRKSSLPDWAMQILHDYL